MVAPVIYGKDGIGSCSCHGAMKVVERVVEENEIWLNA